MINIEKKIRVLNVLIQSTSAATSLWYKNCNIYGACECTTPTDILETGHYYAIIAAKERKPWRNSRHIAIELGISRKGVLDLILHYQWGTYHLKRKAHSLLVASSTNHLLVNVKCWWFNHLITCNVWRRRLSKKN
jgi:hypothetical protein